MNPELVKLKELSSRIGRDSSLIQASGGNTSLKENGVLWVKASGKRLSHALDENIFVAINLELLLKELADNPELENTKVEKICGSNLRASIETSLHALISDSVVLHTHSVDVIACTLSSDAQTYLDKALLGIDWEWIRYRRPGRPLANEIEKVLANKQSRVLILANHGLVVSAETSDKAEVLQNEVLIRLKQYPREIIPPNLVDLLNIVEQIPNARLPQSPVIHSLATDEWSFELVQRNSPYPDHAVFCGQHPWIVGGLLSPPSSQVSYGIVRGVGVFLLEEATSTTEEMLVAQAEIFLRTPPNKAVNLLSDSDCGELINWDAEKYRQALDSKHLTN